MKITKQLLREVVTATLRKTGYIGEAFRMEKDFKDGMTVSWTSLDKVIKKTASGREKVDYERVTHTGVIEGDPIVAGPGHNVPGYAIVRGEDGKTQEVDLTELTPA